MKAICAALLLCFATPSAAAPDSAGGFVDTLYAYYRQPEPGPRDQAAVFAPAVLARYARLDRAMDALGEGGGGDDICQCQDWLDLRVTERTIRARGRRRAEASVRFVNFGKETRVRLLLERTGRGWRVADLFSDFYPQGLAAWLDGQIREAEARLPR